VYQQAEEHQAPTFLGAIVLDFVYPLQEFQRTRGVITLWFAILTALSLGIALMLTVNRVRSLTNPIRRLAEAANRIAARRAPPVSVIFTTIDHVAKTTRLGVE
jgi:hypothetical protein